MTCTYFGESHLESAMSPQNRHSNDLWVHFRGQVQFDNSCKQIDTNIKQNTKNKIKSFVYQNSQPKPYKTGQNRTFRWVNWLFKKSQRDFQGYYEFVRLGLPHISDASHDPRASGLTEPAHLHDNRSRDMIFALLIEPIARYLTSGLRPVGALSTTVTSSWMLNGCSTFVKVTDITTLWRHGHRNNLRRGHLTSLDVAHEHYMTWRHESHSDVP